MKLHLATVALAVGGMLISGCGEESADTASDAGSRPALDDAKAVIVSYLTHGFVGDTKACAYETSTYDAAQNAELGAASCEDRVGPIKEMLVDGAPIIDISKSVVTVTAGEGGSAIAALTDGSDGWTGSFRLIVEDGSWKIDAQLDDDGVVIVDQDAEDSASSGRPEPRTVTEQEAIAFEEAFCQVKPGVTRAKVESWMGAPDEELVDDDGQPELNWYLNQDSYTVWLGSDDTVAFSSSSTPRAEDVC
ncbi:hypothetical protein ACLM5J_18240 [Nocardioides sp. Bht2]|uniref:hypothetical protein n=1 Tax=Nocardioides sp. Bht2 TaxID=3392297 RepID=UPI0039B56DA3